MDGSSLRLLGALPPSTAGWGCSDCRTVSKCKIAKRAILHHEDESELESTIAGRLGRGDEDHIVINCNGEECSSWKRSAIAPWMSFVVSARAPTSALSPLSITQRRLWKLLLTAYWYIQTCDITVAYRNTVKKQIKKRNYARSWHLGNIY